MGASVKLFLFTIWCSIIYFKSVHSQSFIYKHKDVNQYEIRNGKYRLIPTTTRPPTLMETFFPWTGNAYNSVRTPEEDAAILNSISDPVDPATSNTASSPSASDNGGLMSWFPSVPGFGSSTTGTSNQGPPPPMHAPFRPNLPPPGMGYNNIMPMMGSASQSEAVVVPPPGADNQLGALPPSPPMYQQTHPASEYPLPPTSQYLPPPASQYPPSPAYQYPPSSASQYPPSPASQYPPSPASQYPPSPASQYPPPPPQNYMPEDLRNNVNPTFQFHQQVKDSIPIPSPSIGFSPSMFPYPYSAGAGGNLDFPKTTTDKPSSFLDVISNYFTFGNRSDLEEELSAQEDNTAEARSMENNNSGYEEVEEEEEDENNGHEVALKEAAPAAPSASSATDNSSASASSSAPPSLDGKAFPCPKSGIWRWNGEVCIAVGPVPVWACRPNDLIVSGKIAICRNKIYFSPKVINNSQGQRVN